MENLYLLKYTETEANGHPLLRHKYMDNKYIYHRLWWTNTVAYK